MAIATEIANQNETTTARGSRKTESLLSRAMKLEWLGQMVRQPVLDCQCVQLRNHLHRGLAATGGSGFMGGGERRITRRH